MDNLWYKLIDYFSPIRLCREWNESKIRSNCTPGKELTGIAEPVNAWSNLAYIIGGAVAFILSGTLSSVIFALSMTALGIGSFLYHAIPSRKSARLDHFGIYAVFSSLLLLALGAISLMAGLVSWAFAYKFSHRIETDLNATTGVVGILAFLAVGISTMSLFGLGFIGVAFIVWHLDIRGWLLGRYGHGIWHILTAIGITLLFLAI